MTKQGKKARRWEEATRGRGKKGDQRAVREGTGGKGVTGRYLRALRRLGGRTGTAR